MYFSDSPPYGRSTFPTAPVNSTPLTEMYSPPSQPNNYLNLTEFSPEEYMKNPWVIALVVIAIIAVIAVIYHFSNQKKT
jgi:hypothetical protein